MLMHLKYLKSLLRHKLLVYQEGRTLGLSVWRCLIHDWQKFTPAEWFPYVRAFYGPKPVNNRKPEGDDAFDLAWLHHQKFGPHHWQFWIMHEDSGKVYCLPMPDTYRREMLADWRGANRAYGDISLADWYRRNRDTRMLHPETQKWIEQQLGLWECPRCGMDQDPYMCDFLGG
jgi:hypothetical protein